jgi:signal transduction histidine kinase
MQTGGMPLAVFPPSILLRPLSTILLHNRIKKWNKKSIIPQPHPTLLPVTQDQIFQFVRTCFMVASHNPFLVVLSVLVSVLAAYATIALIGRLRDSRGRLWLAWLIGGAVVDGLGTWSMHYTGMLALRLPVPVWYDWPTVLLSLFVGIVGSGGTLLILSHGKLRRLQVFAASVVLGGIGVSGLHYTAMTAMRFQWMHHYSAGFVALSIVLAVVISFLSLSLMFLVGNQKTGERSRQHGSALLRGSANPVMHYTAMAATVFVFSGELPDLSHAISISLIDTFAISIVPLMLLVVTLLTTLVDRLYQQAEQLRSLTAKAQFTREEEATRIAREIHDELGSSLTSLRWDLERVDETLTDVKDFSQLAELPAKIKSMISLTDTAVDAVRRISLELRPPGLDQLGLVEAIEWQAQRFQAQTGIACVCDCSVERVELNPEQSTALYRISQEALTNVLRHAEATLVEIKVDQEADKFVLTIKDNGRGITEDGKLGRHSLGIVGMRERAHLVGGKITINGIKGKGTAITVRVPKSGKSSKSNQYFSNKVFL